MYILISLTTGLLIAIAITWLNAYGSLLMIEIR